MVVKRILLGLFLVAQTAHAGLWDSLSNAWNSSGANQLLERVGTALSENKTSIGAAVVGAAVAGITVYWWQKSKQSELEKQVAEQASTIGAQKRVITGQRSLKTDQVFSRFAGQNVNIADQVAAMGVGMRCAVCQTMKNRMSEMLKKLSYVMAKTQFITDLNDLRSDLSINRDVSLPIPAANQSIDMSFESFETGQLLNSSLLEPGETFDSSSSPIIIDGDEDVFAQSMAGAGLSSDMIFLQLTAKTVENAQLQGLKARFGMEQDDVISATIYYDSFSTAQFVLFLIDQPGRESKAHLFKMDSMIEYRLDSAKNIYLTNFEKIIIYGSRSSDCQPLVCVLDMVTDSENLGRIFTFDQTGQFDTDLFMHEVAVNPQPTIQLTLNGSAPHLQVGSQSFIGEAHIRKRFVMKE